MQKVLAAGENPAKQDGGVHRGDFRVPQPLAGVHIGPVIEETAMIRQFLPQETKRVQDAIARFA